MTWFVFSLIVLAFCAGCGLASAVSRWEKRKQRAVVSLKTATVKMWDEQTPFGPDDYAKLVKLGGTLHPDRLGPGGYRFHPADCACNLCLNENC